MSIPCARIQINGVSNGDRMILSPVVEAIFQQAINMVVYDSRNAKLGNMGVMATIQNKLVGWMSNFRWCGKSLRPYLRYDYADKDMVLLLTVSVE